MFSTNPMHGAAIVGVYNTKQARFLEGKTADGLAIEAAFGAIADAGLKPSDIDGSAVSIGSGAAFDLTHQLGGRPNNSLDGGASPMHAAISIGMGLSETVVIVGSQAGFYREHSATAPWTRPTNEFVECWGLFTTAEFALIARRHMHIYGTKPEHLAEVSSAIRMNGANNPDAIYYGREATPEDVLNSRMIADPFHLLDCCTASEGAAAMVLTTVERAKDLNVKPVYILGAAPDRMGLPYRHPVVWDRYGWSGREGGKKVFDQARLTPKDIDVCEFYDNFSFEIIRLFETYGFCGEGEGGDFVMGGRVRIDGELPIVTDGGLMSFSYPLGAQAMQRIIQGVLQIQGRATNQIKHKAVRHVLTDAAGSAALGTSQLILGAEPM